jgi:predicted small lipoprotein YifL
MRAQQLRWFLLLCLLASLTAVSGCGKKAPPRLPDTSALNQEVSRPQGDGLISQAGPAITTAGEGEKR